MNRRLICLLVCFTLLLSLSVARAQDTIAQFYRSPHGPLSDAALDPNDGSCWVTMGGSVLHVDAEGHVVMQFTAVTRPTRLAVNRADGSCWVSDCCTKHLIHLTRAGGEAQRLDYLVSDLAVDARDGSVWLCLQDFTTTDHDILHLSAAGEELGRITAVANPFWIAVNPGDGSVWVADIESFSDEMGSIKHLAADGTLLWQLPVQGTPPLVLDPGDGSVWIASSADGLYHVSATNQMLWSSTAYPEVTNDADVDPADGSVWFRLFVSDTDQVCNAQIVHLAANGSEVGRIQGTNTSSLLRVSPLDGSLWMEAANGLAHFAPDGTLLWQDRGMPRALGVSVNPTDGSYWLSGVPECPHMTSPDWLARFDALGNELWYREVATMPGMAVDPTDGSLWTADRESIKHYAPD